MVERPGSTAPISIQKCIQNVFCASLCTVSGVAVWAFAHHMLKGAHLSREMKNAVALISIAPFALCAFCSCLNATCITACLPCAAIANLED